MSEALTLNFDVSQLSRLEKAAAEREMSREQLAEDVLAAFLDEEFGDASCRWPPVSEQRDPVSGLLPWQEEKVERGRADVARGSIAPEADLDRIRRKYA